MLASARGVALKAKGDVPQGNMVVFSAASGDETAYPYKEKGHGLFTYFLLKKLQESKGDCTLGELGEYIQTNVRQQSVVINRRGYYQGIKKYPRKLFRHLSAVLRALFLARADVKSRFNIRRRASGSLLPECAEFQLPLPHRHFFSRCLKSFLPYLNPEIICLDHVNV